MVSKAKKAQRKQRQIERQMKMNKEKEQEQIEEKEAPNPPEGSSCSHFLNVSPELVKTSMMGVNTLHCKVRDLV